MRKRLSAGVAGFTLIELLIVIAVAGILAGLAVPRVSDMVARSRAREEVRLVGRVLNNARNLARNARHCVDVEVAGTPMVMTVTRRDCSTSTTLSTETTTFERLAATAVTVTYQENGGLGSNEAVFVRMQERTGNRSWRYRIRGMIGMAELER